MHYPHFGGGTYLDKNVVCLKAPLIHLKLTTTALKYTFSYSMVAEALSVLVYVLSNHKTLCGMKSSFKFILISSLAPFLLQRDNLV